MNDDLISRQAVLEAMCDASIPIIHKGKPSFIVNYVGVLETVPPVNPQESKFIVRPDGTIEQIKNCDDCLFKKEWEKIGKLLSVVLEKQTEQEPKTGHWIEIAQYSDGKHKIECSECGSHIFDRGHANSFNVKNKYKYCPNCGAKMGVNE